MIDNPASSHGAETGRAGSSSDSTPSVTPPAISLPKGGGAIRGMGEKFAANPVTGTGSMSVPIATSPGRSGFGPELSLSYDSGAGNGPFGFGWNLSLPAITRKTDKGLPQYNDAAESDVFILSGAEDLVPILVRQDGSWVPEPVPDQTVGTVTYKVKRYRPRIEGLFARIERWTNATDPRDVHWRSISRDNILTIYGKDANSRIADDPENPKRIFSWLICETRDDKGNAVLYEYKPENGDGVDPTRTHERNRGDRDDPRRTANRYLKHIRYGNRQPLLDDEGQRPPFLTNTVVQDTDWMFEVVFDYGEHDADAPKPDDAGQWAFRDDPFSSYRAGFEVRTTRLCQRVLMFHHFPDEDEVGENCLVRSTDFTYSHEQDPDHARNPVYTFLQQVTQSGYKRDNGGYLKRSLPPVEFEYTRPVVQGTLEEVDAESLANLPIGLDGAVYQWTDLHGEGIPGILTEQGEAWIYKRNLSPINERVENGTTRVEVKFAPIELVATKPNLALSSGAQFMDLAGDGQPDLVVLDGPMPGLYEHDGKEGWQPFRPFTARLNRDTRDPNLKFVDLDGDGHADILITEDDAFVWHASLAEEGFGPARRVAQALDEEKGPRLVLADGTQSIYLADLSGDGLTDLVRIRNGEVCYWPNLGYGRFGAKVTMDHAPHFDNPDQFDHKRIRLADIDGTGTTDIIYLHRDGVRLYFNQSGNGWSEPQNLDLFPRVDDLVNIVPTDLLGNGTACLVWSSPLGGDARQPMRYVNLMGGQKPHLLVKTVNNLGAETRVHYAPSTLFYLQDKRAGKPWITRLPFPVHVVERVETIDHISRNRFVTRYAYHHGYFDGEEREFRGFGMVEQWDTEQFSSLAPMGGEGWGEGGAINTDAASHVPPVHTKTWFHTGVYLDREHISHQFEDEYYREPGLTDDEFRALLLPDTHLPDGLSIQEEREACRGLKGMMLHQEVYADDALPGSAEEVVQRARTPYTVVEQDFTIHHLQPRAGNHHAVFFAHPREVVTYHYERNPADPRITHALTLEVDEYGNVLKEAAIGYGRRQPDTTLPTQADRDKQTQRLVTYTENRVTRAIDTDDAYRTPLPSETRSYELTGYTPTDAAGRFQSADFVQIDPADPDGIRLVHILDSEIQYEDQSTNGKQRRLIEQVRTLYRKDDLTGLLPLGELDPLALPGETYRLAFTPGLLARVFQRDGQPLLPNPADVLGGQAADRGGYVDLENDGRWWMPSGRIFLSPNSADTPVGELAHARQHFFLPHRTRDPFAAETFVSYDAYDLLMVETRDALGNRVTAGERDTTGGLIRSGNDYRVLQPWSMTDPNGNRTQVAFDTLGMVAGTAVMGKPLPAPVEGDSLDDFEADLTQARIDEFYDVEDPHVPAPELLQGATTRIVYDLDRFRRTRQAHPEDPTEWLPVYATTLARETHYHDLGGAQTKIQIGFSYSDGFGREIQKKIQAEPGPLSEGGPIVSPRWVGSGWTISNNKGKPVREYEPFFSQLPEKRHRFEFGVEFGVSPILFYDPVERVVATLHPNHTYEKVVFDPWRQEAWDANDTVAYTDPRLDAEVGAYFQRLPETDFLPSWLTHQSGGTQYQQEAATKALVHADTPAVVHFDALGRPFLTVAHNRFERDQAIVDEHYASRVELDVEGNEREIRDAEGRAVMRYDYDLLGNRIRQSSMEAGERWMLNDVAGNPIRAWDSRGFTRQMIYDELRRPRQLWIDSGQGEWLAEETVYGEDQGDALNHRGRVYRVYDGAGVVTNESYDFKGNLLHSARRLTVDYKQAPDWSADPPLEPKEHVSTARFDALDRPVELIAPDGSVVRPGYNEANLLETIEANLRGGSETMTFVADIDYDAKGQRVRIDYGNSTVTTYDYDKETFRLIRLTTIRTGYSAAERTVQDLRYTYDPVGNITHIQDDADLQNVIFFKNQRVEPSTDYIYDALYRLIEASGREHLGLAADNTPLPPKAAGHSDAPRVGRPHPGDGRAVGRYTQEYVYDAVGNFLQLIHRGTDPAHPGWRREYRYEEPSLLEDNAVNNRLSRTLRTRSDGQTLAEPYVHDAHGNMIRMPHLPLMRWNHDDELQASARQLVNNGGTPETTYYVYDVAGQRVRKVTERQAAAGQTPTRMKERIYLGGFEVYREYDGTGETPTLERETLHIMDDQERIALVETKTFDADEGGEITAPSPVIRYQFGNHLGSASLELDEAGAMISYEEYYPYGSTSYQAGRNAAEVSRKRYRYTGKERDEETGLYYHGARYYACWLGRWTAADPGGLVDGTNLYQYTRNNSITFFDVDGNQSKPAAPPKTRSEENNEPEINQLKEELAEVRGKLASRKEDQIKAEEYIVQVKNTYPQGSEKRKEGLKRANEEIAAIRNIRDKLRTRTRKIQERIDALTRKNQSSSAVRQKNRSNEARGGPSEEGITTPPTGSVGSPLQIDLLDPAFVSTAGSREIAAILALTLWVLSGGGPKSPPPPRLEDPKEQERRREREDEQERKKKKKKAPEGGPDPDDEEEDVSEEETETSTLEYIGWGLVVVGTLGVGILLAPTVVAGGVLVGG